MDPPVSNLGQQIEGEKEASPMFQCNLFDSEVVHKTAQGFLPGLATACVDNTTGDLFKSPASVAADIRKEMIENITQRSETFVAESLIQEGAPDAIISEHPCDIIADFVDDFASSKRNLFSRVSGWLLSEKREDKIDDFVQEMEINRFWLIERREAIAQTLVKNVDYKNLFHCDMKFDTAEELDKHKTQCIYKSMSCTNEGCNARFCALHMEKHDSSCPFKILQCEQKCPARLMRREMDRHCITVCPMKLVNCPFYPVGCHATVPQCNIEQHCSECLQSHVLYILPTIHKEASIEDLNHRAEQLEKLSLDQLCDIQDLRYLTRIVRELDAKMGPLEQCAPSTLTEKHNETVNTPIHQIEGEEIQAQTEEPEILVQAPREVISDKSEGEIQVQTSQGKISEKKEAEIPEKISQEPNYHKEEAELQVQAVLEPINDKLQVEMQAQTSPEPISDNSNKAIEEQTRQELITISDESEVEIQVHSSQEPSSDIYQEEIQAHGSIEPISESKAEMQVQTSLEPTDDNSKSYSHASLEPISDKSLAEVHIPSSLEPTSDNSNEDIQNHNRRELISISEKSVADIQVQSPQETNSKTSEEEIQFSQDPSSNYQEEIQGHASLESISDKSQAEMQVSAPLEPTGDNPKEDIQKHTHQELLSISDEAEAEIQVQSLQEPSSKSSEAEIQVQACHDLVGDELKADIDVQISQEPNNDKQE